MCRLNLKNIFSLNSNIFQTNWSQCICTSFQMSSVLLIDLAFSFRVHVRHSHVVTEQHVKQAMKRTNTSACVNRATKEYSVKTVSENNRIMYQFHLLFTKMIIVSTIMVASCPLVVTRDPAQALTSPFSPTLHHACSFQLKTRPVFRVRQRNSHNC